MICHVPRLTYIGKFSPSTIAATNNTIATAVLIHLLNFVYLRKNPSTTASNMNNMEVVATAPFAATFVTTPASLVANPLKVPATTSANAATTRIQNSQQNRRNNFFPNLPIYSSMIYPICSLQMHTWKQNPVRLRKRHHRSESRALPEAIQKLQPESVR